MKVVVYFVLAVALSSPSFGVILPGQCPPMSGQEVFDIDRYLGTWYEVLRYYQYGEQNEDCVTGSYYPPSDENDGQYRFTNRGLILITGEHLEWSGSARLANPDSTEGKLIITFDIGVIFNYWILETDYSNYTVTYSCENVDSDYYEEVAWIFTREQVVSPAVETIVQNAIAEHLNESYIRWAIQNPGECPQV